MAADAAAAPVDPACPWLEYRGAFSADRVVAAR